MIALSGLTALGSQVVWNRVLGLILGPSVYTFSIILAVFLIGLGIGSGVGGFRTLQQRVSMTPLRITVLDLVARAGGSANHPSSAHYAFGTRRQALAALHMGDLPPNQIDTKVFVVVADGTFDPLRLALAFAASAV